MEPNETNPRHLEDLFNRAIAAADSLQKDYSEAATLAGYARDNLIKVKSYWLGLAAETTANPNLTVVLASGSALISSYQAELQDLRGQAQVPLSRIRSAAGTADTFTATTSAFATIASVPGITEIRYEPGPFSADATQVSLADRLTKLDPALGDTYRQIWESLYGTRSDPERAALYLMRQAFDHLFDHLAPDDAVRASAYWKPKEGEKADQIHRRERIEYAAHTHIKDPNQANTLAASAKQMLEVYQGLNEAHIRGELNHEKARSALSAMKRVIENWAEDIGI